jgi:hypothetical protein
MVVNSRRAQYSGTCKVRIPEEETRIPTGITRIRNPVTLNEQVLHWREHVDRNEDTEHHKKLQMALVEHIWLQRGGESCGIDESDGDNFEEGD